MSFCVYVCSSGLDFSNWVCSWFNYDEQRKKLKLCWMYNDWNVCRICGSRSKKCFIVTEKHYFVHLAQITIRIHRYFTWQTISTFRNNMQKVLHELGKAEQNRLKLLNMTLKTHQLPAFITVMYFKVCPTQKLLKTLQLVFTGLWEVCSCFLCCFDWHLAQNSNRTRTRKLYFPRIVV